jgi:ATP-binding cassette subfamily F protein 3
MRQVATSVIEVRDGKVKNYFGDYAAYLQSVELEIDSGERDRNAGSAKTTASGVSDPSGPSDYRQTRRDQRKVEKEIKNLEKKIASLDDEKRQLNDQLMSETDPGKALKLHESIQSLVQQLEECEERWLELNDEFQV